MKKYLKSDADLELKTGVAQRQGGATYIIIAFGLPAPTIHGRQKQAHTIHIRDIPGSMKPTISSAITLKQSIKLHHDPNS